MILSFLADATENTKEDIYKSARGEVLDRHFTHFNEEMKGEMGTKLILSCK